MPAKTSERTLSGRRGSKIPAKIRIWIVFDGARGEADQALRRRDDEVVTALR